MLEGPSLRALKWYYKTAVSPGRSTSSTCSPLDEHCGFPVNYSRLEQPPHVIPRHSPPAHVVYSRIIFCVLLRVLRHECRRVVRPAEHRVDEARAVAYDVHLLVVLREPGVVDCGDWQLGCERGQWQVEYAYRRSGGRGCGIGGKKYCGHGTSFKQEAVNVN